MPDTEQRTRSTAYGPALYGPLTNDRRTSEEAEEMRENKAEKAKYEREKQNYLAAYKEAVKKASDKYEADLVAYEKKLEEYKHYKEHVATYGEPAKRNRRNPPKPPKRIDLFKVKVPSNPSLYSDKFREGGRRRTRRGRKTRSTRRR